MTPVAFTALIARPIDRVSLAAATAAQSRVPDAEAQGAVAVAPAVTLSLLLPKMGLTWAELDTPLRYSPGDQARGLAQLFADSGHLEVNDVGVSYTAEGLRAAELAVDVLNDALDDLWAVDGRQLGDLHALVGPVADRARSLGTPYVVQTAGMLQPPSPSPAYLLWYDFVTIRRHRSDAHAAAWSSAGHDHVSIRALAEGAERHAIEEDTNRRHEPVWCELGQQQQIELLARLASLNGVGSPN